MGDVAVVVVVGSFLGGVWMLGWSIVVAVALLDIKRRLDEVTRLLSAGFRIDPAPPPVPRGTNLPPTR